ncbi:MAG: mechanosensitive ion channel domain-containing protein [Terriglobales bacterium]
MTHSRRKFAVLAALLLLVIGISLAIRFTDTGNQNANLVRRRRFAIAQSRLVDQQPLQTAQQMEKLVTSREEVRYSRDALNLADHIVDLAFASGLRQAKEHPPAETPEVKQIHDRVRALEKQVKDEDDQIKRADAGIKTAKDADAAQQQLELLSAEHALHQNELEDAQRDLMRAGGDVSARIQQAFTQHQSSQQHGEQQSQLVAAYTSRQPFQVPGAIVAQLRLWVQLRGKQQQLLEAQRQTTVSGADLTTRHNELEKQVESAPSSSVVELQHRAADRKTLSEYDQRIQDLQQLSQTYTDWAALVGVQMLAAIHGVLKGVLWIVLIVLGAVLATMLVDRAASGWVSDRRRTATMKLIGHFAVQGVAVVLAILVLFGSPGQLSTVLALTGAGLTVALKDFIVAFFGWFVLMGRNGIRVGDWVEINGIVGEVVEIGLLRTVLLETGNWADAGHPTGRRVTFVNSFAIEGHYFNFSTTGQWLWDSLDIHIPIGRDPYPVMDAVLQLIRKETEATARVAAQEWQHATRHYGVQAFSVEPAVDIRPTPQGMDLLVRYITSAKERFGVRARLYQEVVDLLHGHKRESATKAGEGGKS